MSSYKKLFSNTLILTIGQFSNKLLSFLLVPLYTALLTTGEYGTFDLVVTTVSLLSPVLTMVATDAVMRFCLDKNYSKPQVLTIGLLLVGIGTAVLLASFPLTLAFDALADIYWWLVAFFVLTNLESVLMQYLKGIENIKLYTGCCVFGTAVTLLLNVLFLAVFKWGITGYMLAMCISRLLIIVVLFFCQKLWRSFVNPFKIDKSVYKAICKFSVPMIPNSISWWISNSSDKYMIRFFISASAVGLYAVAYKIPTMMTVFTTVFISAFQISSVEDFGSEKSIAFFGNVYRAYSSLNIIVASVLIVASNLIAKVLFQNDFFEAWRASCILIAAFVFNTLSAFLGTVYTASKKTSFLFFSTTTAALLNIALNVVLIRFFGVLGAAVATLVSYAVVWIMRLIHSKKILPIKINLWSDITSYVLLGVEIVLMLYVDKALNVWAMAVMLVIVLINIRMLLKTEISDKLFSRFKAKKGAE